MFIHYQNQVMSFRLMNAPATFPATKGYGKLAKPLTEFTNSLGGMTVVHVEGEKKVMPYVMVAAASEATVAVALEATVASEENHEKDEAFYQLKYNLNKAQEQMKKYAHKSRKMQVFGIGEWAFLNLNQHRQQSVLRRINKKLSPKYYGPFQVLEKYRAVTCKLQLPPTSHVHSLKKQRGTTQLCEMRGSLHRTNVLTISP
uniref:Tf2-1-like SH3-like domain-containing protein n=1 Tax=Cajanus cajan TaxID=3821 RepID=A0A151T4E6_CAJCA|nr:hypothetical protein KK1_016413 [Cajanus cajan]